MTGGGHKDTDRAYYRLILGQRTESQYLNVPHDSYGFCHTHFRISIYGVRKSDGNIQHHGQNHERTLSVFMDKFLNLNLQLK